MRTCWPSLACCEIRPPPPPSSISNQPATRCGCASKPTALRLAVTTDDANWRVLCTSGTLIAAPAPSRTRMGRALEEDRWIHATEVSHGTDDFEVALERALDGGLSRVYTPLVGLRPVGVLVLDFRSLRAAEACLRRGRTWITPLGLAGRSLGPRARARATPRRASPPWRTIRRRGRSQPEALLSTVARQAAELVGARSAVVRRCDERLCTFSRPETHGIDSAVLSRLAAVRSAGHRAHADRTAFQYHDRSRRRGRRAHRCRPAALADQRSAAA